MRETVYRRGRGHAVCSEYQTRLGEFNHAVETYNAKVLNGTDKEKHGAMLRIAEALDRMNDHIAEHKCRESVKLRRCPPTVPIARELTRDSSGKKPTHSAESGSMSLPTIKPKTKAAIEFSCPECGAEPGSFCLTNHWKPRLHRSRILLAAERRRDVRK